jgi:hypothetical protein
VAVAFIPDATLNKLGVVDESHDHRSIASSVLSRRRRIGVVKQLAVRTGRLRRSPVVHSRPIDLVVFQEPS